MIIVMQQKAGQAEIKHIKDLLADADLRAHISEGTAVTIIGVVGDKSRLDLNSLAVQPGVDKLVPIMEGHKLAGKTFHPEPSVFTVGRAEFGGRRPVQMMGPCAVESYEQVRTVAQEGAALGATVLRGGAYKPRTSPYSFQGLGVEGLKILRAVADEFNLVVISEITSENDLEEALNYLDIVQIGARNAQNFRLLSAVGQAGVPVMLKRGMSMTIDEWLGSAEYILNEGEYRVMLCERGIRTFETAYRSTLDIGAIPVLKEKTHLPVIVDPSHAAGKASLVAPLARAAVAAGADGLIVEVHPDPPKALSDAAQQLTLAEYRALVAQIEGMLPFLETAPGLETVPEQGERP